MPQHLRRLVIERARECCEYCLVSQLTDSGAYHIDHLTALKHGGQTVSENLALACVDCNLHKGSDLATIDWASEAVIPLFNPRKHTWREHFRLAGAQIVGITAIGQATIRLLRLNDPERVAYRQVLIEAGLYPPLEFK
jgi:5-methylcytosine-specific restriction endonuclease McrA